MFKRELLLGAQISSLMEDHRHAVRSIGIDLGKTTCHLAALDDNGKVLMRRRLAQKQLITCTATLQTCLIGFEACSGAHLLGIRRGADN